MPEGDTILAASNNLHAVLAGKVLLRGDLNWPSAPATGIAGRTIIEVEAYAKHMLMRLDDGTTLRTHLRMDGVWRIVEPTTREAIRPNGYVRAALGSANWVALGYRLGMLDLFPTNQELDQLAHMGPDILADTSVPTPVLQRATIEPEIRLAPRKAEGGLRGTPLLVARRAEDSARLNTVSLTTTEESPRVISDYGWRLGIERFSNAPQERPIGESLLDQELVSGIGTIHMAEALFANSTHPMKPIGEVDVPRILASARANMIRSSLHYPQARRIHVHSRRGLPCNRCNTLIEVIEVGPTLRRRPAFFCPFCQKA